jgi:uroporphyrinogen decarboxylase
MCRLEIRARKRVQSELTAISQAKPMLQVLRRQKSERVPVWLMRQAGRYLPEYRALRASASGFLDFCLTPDLAVEATLQPIVRFGLDAAILFSDILVVPYGLRQRVWFEERVGPLLEPIAGVGDLMRLDTAGMIATLAPVYETVRRVRSRLPAECTLIGFAGAPWTLASYMIEGRSSRDFAKAKLWAYGRPEDFQQLIDLLVDAVSAHLEAQVAAGAEVLQIFDSWAGALDHAATRRWSLEPIRAITARLKRLRPDVPVIVFPRGIGTGYRDFALEGVGDALSLDQAVDPAWAREIIQGKMVLQGNLDPQRLLLGGAGMRLAARRILNCFAGAPFIFNLGHGVLPETPPDHVAELVTTVRNGDP